MPLPDLCDCVIFLDASSLNSLGPVHTFIGRSVSAVFLKQASHNLLQILCAMLFFKRHLYSDYFDFVYSDYFEFPRG